MILFQIGKYMRSTLFICFLVSYMMSMSYAQTQKIDSLRNQLTSIVAESQQRVDLLNEAGYEYWIVNPEKSIEYGKEALNLSEELQYQQGRAKANRVIGVAFWAQGNQNNALQYLIESQADYEQIEDLEGVANTMLNIGMVYADLEQNERALEKYDQAINGFTSLSLDNRIATTFTKMATIFIDQGKKELAKKYLTNALKLHTKNSFTYGIAEVHNRFGVLYLSERNTEEAYHHVQKSMTLGRERQDVDGLTSNYILLGEILRLDGELDTAHMYLIKGLNQARNNNLKKYELAAYRELMEVKKQQNSPEQALAFYDRYTLLKDSIFNIEKSKQIAYLEFDNELKQKDQELKLLKAKERTDYLIKLGLAIVILMVSIIAFITYKTTTKSRQLLQKDQELLASKNTLTQQALENASLKQQELQQQLAFKNKELTSYALNFVQKNELLQQMQEKLDLIKGKQVEEREPLLNELNSIVKRNLSVDKEWEDFKRVFEEVHVGFHAKLMAKHPDLKTNDLKICSLTRLNLNIKETASILGISPESAKTARYRLRKKLELEPKQEIINYLIEVENS